MLDLQEKKKGARLKCRAKEADRCLSRLAEGKGRCFGRTNRTNRSSGWLVGQGNRVSRISKVVD